MSSADNDEWKRKKIHSWFTTKNPYFKISLFFLLNKHLSPQKYRRAWKINFRKFMSLASILLYLEDNLHMFFSFHLPKGTCIINETKLGRKSINKVNLKCRQDNKSPYGYQGVCSCFKTNWLPDVWICFPQEPNRRKSQQLKQPQPHSDKAFWEFTFRIIYNKGARLGLDMTLCWWAGMKTWVTGVQLSCHHSRTLSLWDRSVP